MILTLDARSEMLLAQLGNMSARLERAQREITTGYRVNTASDAPDQVADILSLRASLAGNEQIRTNLERTKSEVDTADMALHRVIKVLERALSLAAAGVGSLSAESRPTIAEEVAGLEQQLVSLSRTMYGDRFVFSGDLDGEPCYRLDENGAVERLASPTSTRQVQYPNGVSFAVARTAQEIFDHRNPDDTPSEKNVFAAVSGLRAALLANDEEAIEASIASLHAASAHVNSQLGFYGAVQNRVAAGLEDAGRINLRLETALSERRDADLAASIMELQQVQLAQQVAMQVRGMTPKRNLFEYLR